MFDPAQGKTGLTNTNITRLIYKEGKFRITNLNDMSYAQERSKIQKQPK